MLNIYDIFKFGLLLQKSFETINAQQSQTTELPWLNWLFSFVQHHIILEVIFVIIIPLLLLIFVICKYNWNKFKTTIITFKKTLQKKREVYILNKIIEENSKNESEEKYINNYINELNCSDNQRIVIALSGLQQCQINEKMIEAILNCLFNNKKNIALRNAIIHALNSMLNSA